MPIRIEADPIRFELTLLLGWILKNPVDLIVLKLAKNAE